MSKHQRLNFCKQKYVKQTEIAPSLY